MFENPIELNCDAPDDYHREFYLGISDSLIKMEVKGNKVWLKQKGKCEQSDTSKILDWIQECVTRVRVELEG